MDSWLLAVLSGHEHFCCAWHDLVFWRAPRFPWHIPGQNWGHSQGPQAPAEAAQQLCICLSPGFELSGDSPRSSRGVAQLGLMQQPQTLTAVPAHVSDFTTGWTSASSWLPGQPRSQQPTQRQWAVSLLSRCSHKKVQPGVQRGQLAPWPVVGQCQVASQPLWWPGGLYTGSVGYPVPTTAPAGVAPPCAPAQARPYL